MGEERSFVCLNLILLLTGRSVSSPPPSHPKSGWLSGRLVRLEGNNRLCMSAKYAAHLRGRQCRVAVCVSRHASAVDLSWLDSQQFRLSKSADSPRRASKRNEMNESVTFLWIFTTTAITFRASQPTNQPVAKSQSTNDPLNSQTKRKNPPNFHFWNVTTKQLNQASSSGSLTYPPNSVH